MFQSYSASGTVAHCALVRQLYQILWNGAHVAAAEKFERRHSANALFGMALAAYVLLWSLYFWTSTASVDIHFDLSEASVWSQQFALGYKHPPMTAWLFILWFSVFPRADRAAYLLAATTVAVSLMITWRLLRDYLDKERALTGIAALMLVPLFAFLASRFNANTVMMPFWVAAQLFYLRARRDLGIADAILAGAFVGLTFLGKYWATHRWDGNHFLCRQRHRTVLALRRAVSDGTECRRCGRSPRILVSDRSQPSYPRLYGHQRDDRPTV